MTFNKAMTAENEDEFLEESSSVIDEVLFLYTGTVEARSGSAVKSVNLVVCSQDDPISDFIDLHNDDGRLDYPGQENV